MKAIFRRRKLAGIDGAGRGWVSKGGLPVDEGRRLVYGEGGPIKLTPTEFRVLCALADHPGPLDRRALGYRAWGESHTGRSNVVEVTVHRLKRKLEAGGMPGRLLSIRGLGYMLSVPSR
ncbi:MAG: winged helix-turn-helix domain-containing protein [Dehalococcoidia bacterium]